MDMKTGKKKELCLGQDSKEGRSYTQPYGDLSELNSGGLIANSIEKETLSDIVSTYLDLLGSSAAVYENNGDYAFGMFSSGWCRFMDQQSRQLCDTDDNAEALSCGKWHCHESCWEISNASMVEGKAVDKECLGGIRIYAEPIFANGEIVGSLNLGYDDPSRDIEKLKGLVQKYEVNIDELSKLADEGKPTPDYLVEIAKSHMNIAAKLIGKTVENKLVNQNVNKLSQIIEQSRACIIITDKSGAIEYVNPYFEELTGYSPDEAFGKNPRFLKSGETSPKEYKKLWDTILAGKTWHGEFHNMKKNGEFYWESTLISPVMDSGEITHFIAIKENITAQKEADARLDLVERHLIESQKLAGIGQLAAGVSHEVLNPVNIISLLTQMLQKDTTDNASLQGFCEKVMSEISRIQKIMGTLLTFSREGKCEREPVLLDDLIDEILDLVEQDFISTGIKIIRQCEREESPKAIRLIADKDKLRQVFLNILNNAKYAMPNGGSLTIGCDAIEKDAKNYMRLKISDTGTGIKEEDLGKVFDHFFTTKPEGEGTGLGLTVIHKIIEDHDGTIRVESEWGKGTTFIIDLPVA